MIKERFSVRNLVGFVLTTILNFGIFYPLIGMGIVLGMILLEISMVDYEFRDFHLIVSAIFALGFTITSFYLEINKYIEKKQDEVKIWNSKNKF